MKELGWQIVAFAPDKPENLKPTVAKNEVGYDLYSDARAEAMKGFGIAWQTQAEMREQYKGYGIDLEEASGEQHFMLPVPAVYLVDTDGKVLFQYVNPNYRERLESDILLAAAKALQ